MTDNVHQPSHYTAGDVECIDAIRAALGPDGFRAYCVGNVIKYNWRHKHKNGMEDLRKASVYLLWAINGNPGVKLGAPPESTEVLASHAGAIPSFVSSGIQLADTPPDDDEGEPYPIPSCATGGCGDD